MRLFECDCIPPSPQFGHLITRGVLLAGTVATAIVTAVSVSVAALSGADATETGMQSLQEVLEGKDGGRYQRISQVALRPCNERGFEDEWVCRIAGLVESVQSKRNEDNSTAGLSAMA